MTEQPQMERHRKQAMLALGKANAVRARQKELRQLCKKGKIDAIQLVRGEYPKWEPMIGKWRLEMLLPLVPGLGTVTMQEVFEVGRFSPTQLVLSLSDSRRRELARLCEQGRRISGHDPARRKKRR